MTDEDDIGFEIHYDKTGSCDKLTEMETVYPYIRLECTNVPITGHLDVTDVGNCSFLLFFIFSTFQAFRCSRIRQLLFVVLCQAIALQY